MSVRCLPTFLYEDNPDKEVSRALEKRILKMVENLDIDVETISIVWLNEKMEYATMEHLAGGTTSLRITNEEPKWTSFHIFKGKGRIKSCQMIGPDVFLHRSMTEGKPT